jgi:hypothetical protein
MRPNLAAGVNVDLPPLDLTLKTVEVPCMAKTNPPKTPINRALVVFHIVMTISAIVGGINAITKALHPH